jgi:hypothetical protein
MSYVSEVFADTPKAFWQCQEASGFPQDSSGNGFHITSVGTTPCTYQVAGPGAGVFGIRCPGHLGAQDARFLRNPAGISTAIDNISFEFWIKRRTTPASNQGGYASSGGANGVWIGITSAGKLQAVLQGVTTLVASLATVPIDSNYHHCVVVREFGTWRYYIDGALDSSPSVTAPLAATGYIFFGGVNGLDVDIAYVAQYDVALTAARVAAHYSAPFVSAPVADFTGTPLLGYDSMTVAFTDASTNTPTSWAWTFGDGGTSTSQNPSYSYTAAGIYTVTLTATNAGGSNVKTRTNYVTVRITGNSFVRLEDGSGVVLLET